MAKTYELKENSTALTEDVEIKITETRDVERYASVSQLKRQHANILQEIERMKAEADEVVSELQAINDDKDISITVKDIPARLLIN